MVVVAIGARKQCGFVRPGGKEIGRRPLGEVAGVGCARGQGQHDTTPANRVGRYALAMKFARYLEENVVDEWRKAYLNYAGLKKLIKRVKAHYDARQTGTVPVSEPSSHPAARLLRGSTSYLTRGQRTVPQYGALGDPETQEPLPRVTLDGTGLEADALPAEPVRATDKMLGAGLEATISHQFDEQERLFFYALDHEVERMVEFYDARELEAVERLSTLVSQLIELAEHRRTYKTRTKRMDGGHLKHIWSKVPRGLDSEEIQRLKLSAQGRELQYPSREPTSSDEDIGHQRREHALEQVHNLNLVDVSEAPKEPRHYDPVQYKTARKKLRSAVVENYRALEILNNYAILNRTGLNKILKKFDKTFQVHIWDLYYDERIKQRSLVVSTTVPQMLHALEDIFANYFEHGDKKRARDILRLGVTHALLPHETGHHRSMFVTGLYIGIALCLVIEAFDHVMHRSTRTMIPMWPQLLITYAVLFLPTLFAVLFGLNLLAWQHVRINAVFIFEFDATTAIDPSQYFELPSLCLWLLALCFYQSFNAITDDERYVSATTWPLLWLCAVVLLLCNPLPIMHRSGRAWFLRSCARVLTGGLIGSIEFRDFFLGDEMNSIAYSVSNLWLVQCEYRSAWQSTCNPSSTYWTPLLSSLPAFLRLMQCIRRHYDSKGASQVHLVNAAKYASTICHAFAYFAFRTTGSQSSVRFVWWIVFATINACFTSSWDILMDWNLLHREARYPFLRMHLSFDDIWPMYYVAMVTNVLIRFVWVIYLFGSPATLPLRSFVAAVLEVFRRWLWNFIRLENEHIGNADTYKIVRELPLPYPVKRQVPDRDGEPLDSSHAPTPTKAQPYHEDQVLASLAQTRQRLAQHRARDD